MKSRVLIITLTISIVAAVVVVGAVVLCRRNPWSPPKVQASHHRHEHLPSSQWEARAKLANSYTLRDGDTLANVATLRYGHQNYYGVIKLSNHIDDELRITAGTTLRLPDISIILAEEGFSRVAARETELILCSRAKYDRVVGELWALHRRTDGNYTIPERVKQELLEAADDLEQATEGLKVPKAGVTRAPLSMIGQLEQSMAGMRGLAEGQIDPYGYDIDLVQQRYGLALSYSIIWAREGFK